MTHPDDPNSLSDSLLDALLGAGPTSGPGGMPSWEPAAARERDRLVAFLKAASAAHDVSLDSGAAERVAARVRHRVREEEDRPVYVAPRGRWALGPLWARVLAASVAVHAVAILVLTITLHGDRAPSADRVDAFHPVPVPRDEVADADVGGVEDGLAGLPGLAPPVPPYAGSVADLPIGPVLAALPEGEGDSARALEPSDPATLRGYSPSVALPMWLRRDVAAKTEILRRLGTPGAATRIPAALAALAARQESDGSFDPASSSDTEGGHSRVQSTATVVLAFESEGHASRAGKHSDAVQRDVVQKGVQFLRRSLGLDAPAAKAGPMTGQKAASVDAAGEAWALLALSEDVMLSSGALTPAETRVRADEVRRLSETVAARGAAAGGMGSLATASAARLRAANATPQGKPWGDAYLASATAGPEALRGTAMLLSGRTADFTAWVGAVLPRVEARFALDGLVRGPGSRVEETALAVLALQVPYRTY